MYVSVDFVTWHLTLEVYKTLSRLKINIFVRRRKTTYLFNRCMVERRERRKVKCTIMSPSSRVERQVIFSVMSICARCQVLFNFLLMFIFCLKNSFKEKHKNILKEMKKNQLKGHDKTNSLSLFYLSSWPFLLPFSHSSFCSH